MSVQTSGGSWASATTLMASSGQEWIRCIAIRRSSIHTSQPRCSCDSSMRAITAPPGLPPGGRSQKVTLNGSSRSKSPLPGNSAALPSRRTAGDPPGPACHVVAALSGRSVSLPRRDACVVDPEPSARGRCTSGVSRGSIAAIESGVKAFTHESNSGRAACVRVSTAAFAAGISPSSAANRSRSSGVGTVRIGGVSRTLPSIAFCVVLLKKAASS